MVSSLFLESGCRQKIKLVLLFMVEIDKMHLLLTAKLVRGAVMTKTQNLSHDMPAHYPTARQAAEMMHL